jgi:hypothetical protein
MQESCNNFEGANWGLSPVKRRPELCEGIGRREGPRPLDTMKDLRRVPRYGYLLSTKRPRGRSSLEAGRSTVVAWTVRACAESVRVPSFSRDLLAKTAGLTRQTTCNGSRPPLYIDEGLQPIEPPTIYQIKSTSRFYLMH